MGISLQGHTYVIMGVANQRSIAWGVAEALHHAGARLIFTYSRERSGEKVKKLVEKLDGAVDPMVLQCNVADEEQIETAFRTIQEQVGVISGVIHSVAYANTEELNGEYVNTSREGYLMAQEISSYSLAAVARFARPIMSEGGSIVAMSYIGGERVVQNYNVMGVAKAALEASVKYLANDLGKDGIRVNAISAGPIRTISAKGVSGFNDILKDIEDNAPLRRPVTKEDVGNTTLFLMSELSKGITGEIIHVDSGYNII
ncbi:enoyl-ACP reductase FabI [Tuberibacillus sp. Marseille-P3662]|uniref:enoyl-ACP reductase FabI n=1 Tax=Tuberibacillus sp. Marseille-P3662 TaxID=1965358 RepID=UPI000A1C7F6B|nr:enoyl-ACP reductase FabI [Tuberibacillus sp. Marseille-P3662]